jgi:hypothetical protein
VNICLQVFTQPVYQFVESSLAKKYPNVGFLTKNIKVMKNVELSLLRLSWRTVYVILATIVAMVIPFFNDIMGILGAIGFWPLTVYFPVAMYIAQHKIPRGSKVWIGLQALSLLTFLVSAVALIGSVQGIIKDVQHIELFAAT